jgi:hypothetical protein
MERRTPRGGRNGIGDEPENRLLNVTEVAEYFRVNAETVRRWLRRETPWHQPRTRTRLGYSSLRPSTVYQRAQMRKGNRPRDVGRNGGLKKGGLNRLCASGVSGSKLETIFQHLKRVRNPRIVRNLI